MEEVLPLEGTEETHEVPEVPKEQFQLSLWEKICGIFIWIGQMLKPS